MDIFVGMKQLNKLERFFRIFGSQKQNQGVQPQDNEHVQPAQGVQGVQAGRTGGNGRSGIHDGREKERKQIRA